MKVLFRELFLVTMLISGWPLRADLTQELDTLQQHLVVLEDTLQKISKPLAGQTNEPQLQKLVPLKWSFEKKKHVVYDTYIPNIVTYYRTVIENSQKISNRIPAFINFLQQNKDKNALSADFDAISDALNSIRVALRKISENLNLIQQNYNNMSIEDAKVAAATLKEAFKNLVHLRDYLNNFSYYLRDDSQMQSTQFTHEYFERDEILSAPSNVHFLNVSEASLQLLNELINTELPQIIELLELHKGGQGGQVLTGPYKDVKNDGLRNILINADEVYITLEKEFNEVQALLESFRKDLLEEPFDEKTLRDDFIKVDRAVKKALTTTEKSKNPLSKLYMEVSQAHTAEDATLVYPLLEKIWNIYLTLFNAVNEFYSNNKIKMNEIKKFEFDGRIRTLAETFDKYPLNAVSHLAYNKPLIQELSALKRAWQTKAGL